MKIALFVDDASQNPRPLQEWAERLGYIRISEYVEVEFPELPPANVLPQRLAAIDREIERVEKRFTESMKELKTARANLTAITDQRETV